ncbi:TorD/DmsD family molecular chaperone, partial [Escherichia coli]|uniref:TorD/DmsD family molecular chaperone n=1 Tax=Escherichia coli TaxID=562 RepID=UPI00309CC9A6
TFLSARGMPLAETPADHIGTLLLAASWLEDQSAEDESEALETLFADYILPWCGTFLGRIEAHATTPFWRTMAPLTRDAIGAMWDELEEETDA